MADSHENRTVREAAGFRSRPGRLDTVLLIEPTIRADGRGWFQETYRREAFLDIGIADEFVQWNHSRTARGVLRGLHFQGGPNPQAKLIRSARGTVFDVVVDIRRASPTFGRWEGHVLDAEAGTQLYCPAGFAHGFQALSEIVDVVYACSEYYDPASDHAICATDPMLGIRWPLQVAGASDRDSAAPLLADLDPALLL